MPAECWALHGDLNSHQQVSPPVIVSVLLPGTSSLVMCLLGFDSRAIDLAPNMFLAAPVPVKSSRSVSAGPP